MDPKRTPHEQFLSSSLFRGLSKDQIESVFSIAEELRIEKGTYLIREGEIGKEFYVLVEGELTVSKYDSKLDESHVIGKIRLGQPVGEISLIDNGPRSASVQAATDARLYRITFDDLTQLMKKKPDLIALQLRLSENIGSALRHTDEVAIEALRNQVTELRTRSKMGTFLIGTITILSFYVFILPLLQYLMKIVPSTSVISIPLTVTMGAVIYALTRHFKMPLEEVGITTTNLKASCIEGIAFSFPWMLFGVSLKLFLIYFNVIPNKPLFDPYSIFPDPQHRTLSYWLISNAIYCLLFVPLQELLARGVLQGLLEKFLLAKHRVIISIVMSNLIFASIHVFFSVYFALIVLVFGMFLGWLYSRNHNLAGCSIAHALVGGFSFSVLGLAGILFE
ncbi:MAG: cyclic nucleotide-binding domain-containing protein [Parachlamydiales bacterium]|nr:cyclic nucleotide-binding domain-containing protein [Parachlamydiales bacterium]